MPRKVKMIILILLSAAALGLAVFLCRPQLMGARVLNTRQWNELTGGGTVKGTEPLCWEGQPLPEIDGVYLLSQDPDVRGWTGKLTCGEFDLSVPEDEWQDKETVIREGTLLTVAASPESGPVQTYTLQVSGLPVLSMTCTTVNPKDNPYDDSDESDRGRGSMTLLWSKGKGHTVTTLMEYSLRGRSNYWSAKPNYRLHLIDYEGASENHDLLGLRDDDDWLLYSLCTDPTRAREMSLSQLWNELAAAYSWDYECIRMEYVELYINGSYRGVYGLAVPVDAKSLELTEDGRLYKWRDSILPEKETLSQLDTWTEEYWGENNAVRLIWPTSPEPGDWKPLESYARAFLYEKAESKEEADSLIDLNNQLDAAMFHQFACLTDNFLVNRIYVQFEEDGPIYRIPWDLDLSLGNYVADLEEADLCNSAIPDHELDTLYELDPDGLKQAAAERWQQLRKKYFNVEHMMSLLRANNQRLADSGALAREMDLWGETGGAAEANDPTVLKDYFALDLDETEEFLNARMAVLDDYYADYTPADRCWAYYMKGF